MKSVPSNSPSTNDGVKRKAAEKPGKSGRKGKKRRDDPDSNAEWRTRFMEMWERSMEQDNARFESSAEMYREAQRMQMEQTKCNTRGIQGYLQRFGVKVTKKRRVVKTIVNVFLSVRSDGYIYPDYNRQTI